MLLVKTDQGIDSRVRFCINQFLDQYSFFFPHNEVFNLTLCISAIVYVLINKSYGAEYEKNVISTLMCVFFYWNSSE